MVAIKRIVLDKKKLGLLSPLENDVLKILWKKTPPDSMKVRDIHRHLRKKRRVALTSVAVILDRLHEKRIVRRTTASCRGGYHYIYSATPKNDFEQSVIEKTVDKLIDNYGSVAVTYFNERFAKKREK